jgi:hypothetical protein
VSEFSAGDSVRVNDTYLDGNLVGLEGRVRNLLDDGCMVILDSREQPYFFYESELDYLDPDELLEVAEELGLLDEKDEAPSSDFRAFDQFHIGVDPAAEGAGQVFAKPLTDLGGPWRLLGNAVDAPPHFTVNVPERQSQYRIVGTWEDPGGEQGCEDVGPLAGDLEAALIEFRRHCPEADEAWDLYVEERVVTETSWKRSELEAPEDPRDARISELEAEVREWKGNHAGVVGAKRKLHQRFDDLFRAKSLPPLEALSELERLIRQLRSSESQGVHTWSMGYDEARDDVIDLITDLAQELTCRNP